MRIKGHYNAHKLRPLSATIFMLSIFPKLRGRGGGTQGVEDGDEALGRSGVRPGARHVARALLLLILVSLGINALRGHIFL